LRASPGWGAILIPARTSRPVSRRLDNGRPDRLTRLAARARAVLARPRADAQAHELAAICEVSRIVNSVLDTSVILRAVARELHQVIPYHQMNFAFYDPRTDTIAQHRVRPGDWDTILPVLTLPAAITASWVAIQERRTIVCGDTRRSSIKRHRELVPFGILSVVTVPLVRDDRCLGVLNVDFEHPDPLSAGQVAFLEALAAHLSVAIDNARLFDELQRELAERKRTEAALRESEVRYRQIIEVSNEGIYVGDAAGNIIFANAMVSHFLGYAKHELLGIDVTTLVAPEDRCLVQEKMARRRSGISERYELRLRHKDGSTHWVIISASPIVDERGQYAGFVAMFTDVTERRRAEIELRQAQKLESVGRLAAGIAHEINTPIQFIGDNAHFLQEGFATLAELTGLYGALREATESGQPTDRLLGEIREAEARADLSYLTSEIPRAIDQSLEGVARVARIVQAMKEVAHHGLADASYADLNQAIRSTLIVATSELKYVADVETDFGDLPPVLCRVDELNQVFLNLLVNAAHAIADANKQSGDRGTIRVSTRQEGADAVVSIADSGTGIPEAIRTKVFDQFFTTKEVGRGTGQGLPLARSVVEKHGGSLTFDSEIGRGTAFHIRIPVQRDGDTRGGEAA
jgi:two-component system, NtrC family, sensor kinase